MTRSASVLFATLAVVATTPPGVAAQETDGEAAHRVLTVSAGVGQDLGWFGVGAEKYLFGSRLSAFGGAGYTPEVEEGVPTGPTFAGGLRWFSTGTSHRGILEANFSQVAVRQGRVPSRGRFVESARLYGPGILLGWQYAEGGRGLTLMASGGAGYALGSVEGESPLHPIFNLAAGWTW